MEHRGIAFREEQRRVAVGEEAIARGDRMAVDRPRPFEAHQRRDEHQQRRLRQVEVGHQPVGDAELEARPDEDVGLPRPGRHPARPGRRGLDQPQRRRPDRDHPPLRRVDRLGRLRADLAPFGVHPVPLDVRDLDRQEGPGADVQRQPRLADAARRELGEQRLVEVQRRRRRRHRARAGGEHRLIVLAVLRVGPAPRRDVGRQRHLADRLDRRGRAPRRRGRRRAAPRRRPSPRTSAASASPKPMRSPTASRLPGRASARQSPSPAGAISVASMALPSPRGAAPHARAAAPGSPWCR